MQIGSVRRIAAIETTGLFGQGCIAFYQEAERFGDPGVVYTSEGPERGSFLCEETGIYAVSLLMRLDAVPSSDVVVCVAPSVVGVADSGVRTGIGWLTSQHTRLLPVSWTGLVQAGERIFVASHTQLAGLFFYGQHRNQITITRLA